MITAARESQSPEARLCEAEPAREPASLEGRERRAELQAPGSWPPRASARDQRPEYNRVEQGGMCVS